jgi:hypothetical protein
VPVVAIFTKFDALEDVAYGKLIKEGYPAQDAVGQTADRAVADFEREYLPLFRELEFPPKGYVYLRGNARILLPLFMASQVNSQILDMNKPKADCRQLVDTVATVLGKTELQQLFVSTQQNNLEICMKHALEK